MMFLWVCTAGGGAPLYQLEYPACASHVCLLSCNSKGQVFVTAAHKSTTDSHICKCMCTGRHWMYEATVGAGLPVLSTLKNLLDSGDRVVSIEGILSGTLSYLFNSYRPGDAFSGVVAQAKALGYTEPDPRDDLSGEPGWHCACRVCVGLGREGLGVDLCLRHHMLATACAILVGAGTNA